MCGIQDKYIISMFKNVTNRVVNVKYIILTVHVPTETIEFRSVLFILNL